MNDLDRGRRHRHRHQMDDSGMRHLRHIGILGTIHRHKDDLSMIRLHVNGC